MSEEPLAKSSTEEPREHRSDRLRVGHVPLTTDGATFGVRDAGDDRVRGAFEDVVW